MASVLAGRGERLVASFLKEHYGFAEGHGEIKPALVNYEIAGGYLACILMPDKCTRSGEPYLFERPHINILDPSSPLHSEDIAFYSGMVLGWRETFHFIGREDELSKNLKDITVALREHFWPEDFNRDLGAAVRYWFPDFEIP